MAGKKKIIHYRNKCIGCGLCALLAPDDWAMSPGDGKAVLKGGKAKGEIYTKEIDLEDEAANRDAAKNCPVNIIKIF